MSKVAVRPATLEDVDWLITQLRAFEVFAGYKRTLLEDEVAARQTLAGLIAEHVVLIAHEEAERRGFIAGMRAPHPFNKNLRVLSELFWWVQEEYRGGRAGITLLDAFEEIGRKTSDWTILSLEHNSLVREVHLTKRGFRCVERAYLLEVGG